MISKSLLRRVIQAAEKAKICIVSAESLTAGLIASSLASVSGASSVLFGGLVTYSPRAKTELLGVPTALIESEGVVSEAVAKSMALGAASMAQKAEPEKGIISVSVTGVAGPTGGTQENPIGTVWFGLVFLVSGKVLVERTEKLLFKGTRNQIRTKTVKYALKKILSIIEEFGEIS